MKTTKPRKISNPHRSKYRHGKNIDLHAPEKNGEKDEINQGKIENSNE